MSDNYNNTITMNYGDSNQNGQKPKKGNKAIIAIIVIVLVLLIAGAVVIFVLPKFQDKTPATPNTNAIPSSKTTTNSVKSDVITAKKQHANMYYVYESSYEPQDPAQGYFMGTGDYYDVSLLKVPFINIDSASITEANNKIHGFYDEAVKKYNEFASSKNAYIKINYQYYMNNNVLSVVVEQTIGGNGIPQNSYLAFNYDLVQNKLLTFVDMYKLCGFTDETIDKTVEYEIENSTFFNIYGSLFNDEESLKLGKVSTIEDYTNRKNENSFNYFMDSKGVLNLDINYKIPNAGELTRLLTINKSNEQQPTNPNANQVEENTTNENAVEANEVEEEVAIVDANGNLDLTNYEDGFYACYFPKTTTVKTEVNIYKEQDKWFMELANRNGYEEKNNKVTTIKTIELAYNNGEVSFSSPVTTFMGTITFNGNEISIKVEQAALNTNITPSTIVLNVKENMSSILPENQQNG